MKQVEYTDKQNLVLEILNAVINAYQPDVRYDFQKEKLFLVRKTILAQYGIKEKFLTLKEFIKKYESGAYHHFIFTICDDIKVDVIGIDEYNKYYVSDWLDRYYVINYQKQGGNEGSDYFLELSPKDD